MTSESVMQNYIKEQMLRDIRRISLKPKPTYFSFFNVFRESVEDNRDISQLKA